MSTAYAVFTTGTDYYDRPELDSLYASRQDAETHAAALRAETTDLWGDGPEPLYASVRVEEWQVQ